MTFKELVDLVAADTEMTKKDTHDAIKRIFTIIGDDITAENKLMVHNFGTFKSKMRKERRGRNPQDGKYYKYPKKRVAQFSAHNSFEDEIQ